MTSGFQPYRVSEFKTGLYTYLQPWIRPADAFEPLVNAYVNRAIVNKRNGFTQFGNTVNTETLVITGISQAASAVVTAVNYFTPADYGVTMVTFSAVVGMVEINGLTGTVTAASPTTFTVNINSTGFTAYTSGGIATYTLGVGQPIMGIMRYVDESTGMNSLLIATFTNLYLYDPGTGNYNPIALPANFTGNITNFFNWTNWQPTSGSASTIYMTNDKDPVTEWTGSGAATQPALYVDSAHTTTITTCLDLKVYKQRLLYILPTLSSSAVPENQTIIWSAITSPNNVVADVAGNGGSLAAPTGDIIQSAEFIRDVLVVFFTNSTWIFRYTGNDSRPFQWDKVNDSKSTNAPYGSIAYDQRCTSIGQTGFIACDAVNVQRYDIPIIDYYETNMSEQYYGQTFAQRYDNLNQGWMLYVSNETPFPLVGGIAPGSDSALIYNFVENTFATYTFPIPLTCLGIYYNQTGTTWEELIQSWETTRAAWNSFQSQKAAPILLAGDTMGHVWLMDDPEAIVDEQLTIEDEVIATGNGGMTYTGTVANPPIVQGTFSATDGIETFSSTSTGALIGNMGGTGSINFTSGAFILNFAANVASMTPIYGNYLNGTSIIPDIVTTRWNPVLDGGQKVQFGWIDIFYRISSTDANNPISVTLNFYVDNSENIAASRTLTLDGPSNSEFAFKRIYMNLIGEFFQMEIDPDVDAFMQFVGFVIWAKPAGRLTP
jgi:hypothetical protein